MKTFYRWLGNKQELLRELILICGRDVVIVFNCRIAQQWVSGVPQPPRAHGPQSCRRHPAIMNIGLTRAY